MHSETRFFCIYSSKKFYFSNNNTKILFLWLAIRYRLLTADLLAKRGWLGPSICPLCCAGEESSDHLFFYCSFARSVWVEILENRTPNHYLILNSTEDFASRWRSARAVVTGQSKLAFDLLFAAGCWEVSIERNKRLFENRLSSIHTCASRALSTADYWSLAHSNPTPP